MSNLKKKKVRKYGQSVFNGAFAVSAFRFANSSRSCAETKEIMCSRQFEFCQGPNNAAKVESSRRCLDGFSARVIGMIYKGFPHVEMCSAARGRKYWNESVFYSILMYVPCIVCNLLFIIYFYSCIPILCGAVFVAMARRLERLLFEFMQRATGCSCKAFDKTVQYL